VAIDEALDAKQKGDARVILFNLSGHGNFDLSAYQAYLSGKLTDFNTPINRKTILRSLPELPPEG